MGPGRGSRVACGGGRESLVLCLHCADALTLHRDRFTTARRTAPIPQLQCLGGSAGCPAHIPEIVQCRNKGWDGFDVQWECKAELDTSYRFGKTAVSCEGYDYPDDPYVLRGSCGLEFNLELTEQGRKKYKDASGGDANSHGNTYGSNYFPGYVEKMDSPVPSSTRGLLAVVILLVLALGVYKLFLKAQNEDLPPPYTEHPQDHQRFFQASPPPPPPPPGFKSYFTGMLLWLLSPEGWLPVSLVSVVTGRDWMSPSPRAGWVGRGFQGILKTPRNGGRENQDTFVLLLKFPLWAPEREKLVSYGLCALEEGRDGQVDGLALRLVLGAWFLWRIWALGEAS
uniref:Store-operated calcium entry-associated regulatory factor n=1 Tax=Vombatus ursinus TaxID=29139 RepID=A0A4X2KUM5_VOMUR